MSQAHGSCPHCGALLDRGARFCHLCGARTVVRVGASVAAILLAVLLLLAAAGLGAVGACFLLFGFEGGVPMLVIGGVGIGLALLCAVGAAALLTPKRRRT